MGNTGKKIDTFNDGVSGMGHVRRVHFVGIGGAGMGGIAEVLHTQGFVVSGSDKEESAMTRRLGNLGISIAIGHGSQQVIGADVVVTSSAVKEDNVEVVHARQRRIPVIPRAEMLAELMRFRFGIAVAGTHGKTTVTALIANLLAGGGLDPTFVIGGRLNSAGVHARLGAGKYLVAEADESDRSFLLLSPMMAVVTNIDVDHMGTYGGDFEALKAAFLAFLHRLPFYGPAVLCLDDPVIKALRERISRPVVTFGFEEGADFRARILRQSGSRCVFRIRRPGGLPPFDATLNMPGRHNVLNALAAVAIAQELARSNGHALPDESLQRGLEKFQGIARRFQVFGEIPLGGRRVLLIDDYGHHPREIAATFEAIRVGWPARRLVVAFQPHRYTRTRDLLEDFCQVLPGADCLLLLDIYSASEAPLFGVDGRYLHRTITERGGIEPVWVEKPSDLPAALAAVVETGDVVLILGAGDIGEVAPRLAVGSDEPSGANA